MNKYPCIVRNESLDLYILLIGEAQLTDTRVGGVGICLNSNEYRQVGSVAGIHRGNDPRAECVWALRGLTPCKEIPASVMVKFMEYLLEI